MERSEVVSYNSILSTSYENKEKLATYFSEGNDSLKKLLLECWDNRIGTISCCAGHSESEHSYISFNVDSLSIPFISSILSEVKSLNLDIKTMSFSNNSDNKNLVFSIYSDYKNSDNFFNKLNDIFKMRDMFCDEEKKSVDEITSLYVNSSSKFTFDMSIKELKDSNFLWYIDINGRSSDVNPLSAFTDGVRNERIMYGGTYSCDENDLRELNITINDIEHSNRHK